VALNGTGATGPTPLAVPASLTFGNQAVNTVSAPQAVTFSNAGDMAFSFLGVRASENFSATSNCPSSIGPGVSCTINVTFAPTNDTNTGFLTSGTVFVTTNAPGSPFAFSVAGTSTAAAGAATLASISSNLNPSLVGQAVTFTASITSATPGTPSGTVTFLDNGAALGAPVTLSAGKAMFTISTLSQGNHSIFCTYSGDGTFAPSTSSGIGQTVDAVTMTAAASSLNPSTVGENVTFTATVTSPTPGAIAGEVEFLDGASAITNPLALSGGSVSFSTTTLTQGTHSITAKYFGDPSHAVSTSPAVAQVVNAGGALASTTTAVVSSLNPATVGQNVTFTATATSATAGTLTGTLTFFDGATQIGAAVTINAGSAMVSTTTLTQGTHSITAKYSGDTKFAASTSAALTQMVVAGALTSTTTMLTGPATGSAGASVSFMASVTPANGTKVPTGMVTFLDGATNLGNSSLNGSGSASFSTSTLSAGAHTVTAQYGGDANFAGSTSNGVAINITAATGTFTLSVAPSSVTVTPSQPGMTVVTVTPVNGFNQAVQFSCANLPEGVDCEFTAHSVTPNGGPATTMLAITEEAENAAGGRKSGAPMATWRVRGGANGLAPAMKTLFVPVLGCEMLLLAGLWRRRKFAGNRAGLRTAFAVLLLMTVATFAGGCSDAPHSHNIGTTITVVGTGPGNQTAMATLTVNVKK
jgi:Bacterial Ig-like domain (group 3)